MDKKTAFLAGGILLALIVAVLFAGFLPQGEEDVSFEYQVFLKEVLYDADGHATALRCVQFSDQRSEILVSLEKVRHAYTPSGKTSFKKLNVGDLLFVSVASDGDVRGGNPPVVVADVVMVKSVGAPDPER